MFYSKNLKRIKKLNHCFFSRKNGFSKGIYSSLNCGKGSKDNKMNIHRNLNYVAKKINVKKKNEDWNEKIEKEFFSKLVKQFDYQSNPLYSSSRLWDDGIIDPRDTRNILSECLQISLNSKIKETKFGLFRM